MSLRISSLELFNFRSYENFALDDVGDLTIFIGRNAIGKTNVLEAIHLVTSATSFRHPQIAQLVRDGSDMGRVAIQSGDGNRSITTELKLEVGKRRYLVNGKAKHAVDVRGVLPAVVFTPDDLELAKKSPSVRRGALDEAGAQLSRNYYIISKDYEKALRYKNRLLKDDAPRPLVDAINETLVTCGAQLFCYRYALYGKMSEIIGAEYSRISHEHERFGASYLPSWDHLASKEGPVDPLIDDKDDLVDREKIRSILYDALERLGGEERARKRSLVGPHNDKISFYIDGRDVAQFASQGQQRSIVLAWKLAEVEMVRRTLGTEPVLLLDDVMSELDSSRRDMLVENVTSATQTFITATDLSAFNEELLERARIVDLEKGSCL